MRVLICGGGVIGTSIAYFLSQRGIEAVVIERTGIANAASGKSGGFLALDWCDGSPAEALARRSFDLHAELAQRIDDEWGYRRLDTLGVVTSARRDVGFYRKLAAPDWLAGDAAVHARLGTAETTAQVNPAAFTGAVMRAALAAGARLTIGTVTGLVQGADGAVQGVMVDGQETRRRCGRHRHGPVVGFSQPMAAPAGGLWLEGPQPGLPLCADAGAPRALRGTRDRGRHLRVAGSVSPARRHDLRLRPLQRGAAAGGPRRRGAGRGRRGPAPRHDGAICTGSRRRRGAGRAGLLPPRRRGRAAAHRCRPRRRGCLCGDGSLGMGRC